MQSPGSKEYEEEAPYQTPHPGPMPPAQYKFSPEEMRVLKECNAESFVQRSVPLGTALGLATFMGTQKGYLKPNPRFGAFPKVSLAVIVGYFIGKISYQQACAEKLMALPDSYIGQLLRDKRDGKPLTNQPKFPHKSTLGITSDDIYSDAGPGSALDLDTTRPLFGDDTYRPNNDSGHPPTQTSDGPSPSPLMSYDDLRKKNRGEYTEERKDPYRLDPNQTPMVRRSEPKKESVSTNKYGDVME